MQIKLNTKIFFKILLLCLIDISIEFPFEIPIPCMESVQNLSSLVIFALYLTERTTWFMVGSRDMVYKQFKI